MVSHLLGKLIYNWGASLVREFCSGIIRRFLCRKLDPLEEALLKAVADRLPPCAANIMRQQVVLINHVQRFVGRTRDVEFFQTGRNKKQDMPQFPNRSECKLASVEYRIRGGEDVKKISLWLVRGRIFSMSYAQRPSWREAFESSPAIDRVVFHADPMLPLEPVEMQRVAHGRPQRPLKGGLMRLHERGCVDGYFPATSFLDRQSLLAKFDCVFPSDYLDLLEQTDGLVMKGAVIYGIAEVHELHLEQGDFVAIGDIVSPAPLEGTLCLGAGETPRGIYFCSWSSEQCRFMGNGLYEALYALCGICSQEDKS